jgi:uncharacterized protein YceH (UPF0502 family)
MRTLSPLEARVLGVLVEKALTVPDSYPLTLNSLVAGCNQKTARDPVISATDSEVQVAVDSLRSSSLVFESSGSRVSRYEHNMGRVMALPSQSVALLAVLALRGPQTTAELRTNGERLHRFADLSSVEGFLVELAERPEEKGGPLVTRLSRLPGAREARWAHLLCGPVANAVSGPNVDPEDFVAAGELSAMKARQSAMQAEIDQLRKLVTRMCAELGIDPDAAD